MNPLIYDVVIIGSGPAGVHATYPLLEAGLKVAMVDGGLDSKERDETVSSEQISPTRSNALDILMKGSAAFAKTYSLLKVKSNIDVIQTLAKGGLSEFWHGISDFLTGEELRVTGLPEDEIQAGYLQVSKRVNLGLKPQLDNHGKLLLKHGVGRTYRLSVTYPYHTSSVVEKLKKRKNFKYIPLFVVQSVTEEKAYVEIEGVSTENTAKKMRVQAKYVILAAGSINTTRILLRSKRLFNYKTSFLTKVHSMVVCLHPRVMFADKQSTLLNPGQVALNTVPKEGKLGTFVQIYRLNPFMIDKAAEFVPLPKLIASWILSLFKDFLVIADLRFPCFESDEKYCKLVKTVNGGDVLEVRFKQTQSELEFCKEETSRASRTLLSIGLIPLKVVSDPVTSHYGGGVPFEDKFSKLWASTEGLVNNTKRIYVGDSASWRALPGKPLALTIMANASRVGKNVLKNFKL